MLWDHQAESEINECRNIVKLQSNDHYFTSLRFENWSLTEVNAAEQFLRYGFDTLFMIANTRRGGTRRMRSIASILDTIE